MREESHWQPPGIINGRAEKPAEIGRIRRLSVNMEFGTGPADGAVFGGGRVGKLIARSSSADSGTVAGAAAENGEDEAPR